MRYFRIISYFNVLFVVNRVDFKRFFIPIFEDELKVYILFSILIAFSCKMGLYVGESINDIKLPEYFSC